MCVCARGGLACVSWRWAIHCVSVQCAAKVLWREYGLGGRGSDGGREAGGSEGCLASSPGFQTNDVCWLWVAVYTFLEVALCVCWEGGESVPIWHNEWGGRTLECCRPIMHGVLVRACVCVCVCVCLCVRAHACTCWYARHLMLIGSCTRTHACVQQP